MSDDKVKIEEVTEETAPPKVEDDDDVPALVEPTEGDAHEADGDADDGDDKGSKQSKGEKKARKALSKMGLKPVEGITRVTMKKAKIHFVIANPDVYKSGSSDTYIIYGEAKMEDPMGAADPSKFKPEPQPTAEATPAAEAAPAAGPSEGGDEEVVDETGLEQKDIELVMAQANVGRGKAVKALKNNNNDIVNAIMELTM
eukprot:NODE_1670_length_776_cov_289.516179_g1621_i0.p1 GENE.NODE_1670_length_776_cov_289.516179_g1621_i0~~NODE_1670_length_776_cov_289.516179_g1621_i0.p1  ORF type:complete len:200 (+),score=74.49 NODE_1670_length_776_cov_289.516179_g1621_i0:132-731(+)